MLNHMHFQMLFSPETFSANFTLIWFLSSMYVKSYPFQILFSLEISHSCSSSPVCILNHVTCWILCTFKCCFLRKRFPQTSHLNGFSPVCIRQCDFIWARFLSARPQLVQIYALPGSVEHLYHGCASETKRLKDEYSPICYFVLKGLYKQVRVKFKDF